MNHTPHVYHYEFNLEICFLTSESSSQTNNVYVKSALFYPPEQPIHIYFIDTSLLPYL